MPLMSRYAAVALLLLSLAALSCGHSKAQSNPNESLDAYLSRTYTATPGVAVSVVSRGEIVFEKGYGLADRAAGTRVDTHTRFLLASVTKQITGMAVMMLKESGRFTYETPLVNFFPEFGGFAKDATIRQLLQHTAGFPLYYELCEAGSPVTNSDVVRFVVNRGKMDFAPGTRHEYSDTGYALLAELVARVSGERYADFVDRRIFEPLGMKESFVTRWGIPSLPNVARSSGEEPFAVNCNTIVGDGGAYSSAHDIAIWNQFLERNTVVGTTAAMDEAYQPARVGAGGTAPYGFGWRLSTLEGNKQYAHTGSWMGFSNLNARLPEKRFSVVVLANDTRVDREAIVRKAVETLLR
jgi:CubicO group peptidase (beta-lactamase class C family)